MTEVRKIDTLRSAERDALISLYNHGERGRIAPAVYAGLVSKGLTTTTGYLTDDGISMALEILGIYRPET